MSKRILAILTIVGSSVAARAPSPALANPYVQHTSNNCTYTVAMAFSPALGLAFVASGTVGETYAGGACIAHGANAGYNGSVWPPPAGESASVHVLSGPYTVQEPYSGSIFLAFPTLGFWGNTPPGILVGGSVAVGYPPGSCCGTFAQWTELDVMDGTPPSISNEFGAGHAIFEFDNASVS
jgi:hypothetical protein